MLFFSSLHPLSDTFFLLFGNFLWFPPFARRLSDVNDLDLTSRCGFLGFRFFAVLVMIADRLVVRDSVNIAVSPNITHL